MTGPRAEQNLPKRVDPICWRCQRPVTVAIETVARRISGIPQPLHRAGCVPRLTPQPRKEPS